jgi:hypothetical protein
VRHHPFSVSENGDSIGDAVDLVELVRDVDDRHSARLEPLDHPEQRIDLGRAERGGRFVHHDQPCLPREGTGDLDQLLFGDAQLS